MRAAREVGAGGKNKQVMRTVQVHARMVGPTGLCPYFDLFPCNLGSMTMLSHVWVYRCQLDLSH